MRTSAELGVIVPKRWAAVNQGLKNSASQAILDEMQSEAARRGAGCILALSCWLPCTALGEPEARPETQVWVSALGAFGDALAASPRRSTSGDPLAAVPALVSLAVSAGAQVDGPTTLVDAGVPALAPRAADETQRWVPAFALFSGVFGQQAEGSVQSGTVSFQRTSRPIRNVPGVTCPPAPTPLPTGWQCPPLPREPAPLVTTPVTNLIRPSAADHDLFVTPFVGLSIEMMTPGFQEVPGRPRLFLHHDASLAFSATRYLAKQGVPGPFVFPDPVPPGTAEGQVDGQGSATQGEVKTLTVSAGVGPAFTIDVWERRLRIKPSFEYFREEIEVTGVVRRVLQTDSGRQVINNNQVVFPTIPDYPVVPTGFFPLVVQGSETKTFHGIGPGLEVELDTARAGPFMLSVFTAGQAYRMLGDRDIEIDASTTLTDPAFTPNPQTVTAQFDFHKHAWTYRGGVGLRFRWLPED